MLVLAVEIPDAYLVAVLPVILVAVIGLMAWIVKEMGKIQIINAAMARDINRAHDDILELKETVRLLRSVKEA